jgi:hypothetical protein
VTRSGEELRKRVPAPSSPEAFIPQQRMPPALVSAHVWAMPVVTLVAALSPRAATAT